MQFLYEVWTLVAPYLDTKGVLCLRRVHRTGGTPFPREEGRLLFVLVINRQGVKPIVSTVDVPLPLPPLWPADAGLSWRPHDVPQYGGTCMTMPMKQGVFKGFLTPQSVMSRWGWNPSTRHKRLAAYITGYGCYLERDGTATVMPGFEIGCTEYTRGNLSPRLCIDRLRFQVLLSTTTAAPDTSQWRVDLIAGHECVGLAGAWKTRSNDAPTTPH
jgi:hypothetical protein